MKLKSLLAVLILGCAAAASADTPKIGIITPLSGAYASFGDQIKAGMQMAAGNDAKLIFEDSQFDVKTALSAYRKLTSIDKINYLISAGGETCGVLNREAQRDQIPHIAVGCNTEVFENEDSYSFRLDVNEAIAAAKLADYLKEHGARRLAVINIENTWGTTVAKFATAAFKNSGIDITEHSTFLPSDAGNVRSLLEKVRRSGPERLFVVASPETFALVLKQLKEIQFNLPLISTISVENPEFIKLSGANANGVIYLAIKEDPRSKTSHPEFFKQFPEKNTFTAWGYDAVLLLLAANSSPDPKGYLQNLRNFPGAFNVYNYDKHGEVNFTYELRTIQDGQYKFLDTVS